MREESHVGNYVEPIPVLFKVLTDSDSVYPEKKNGTASLFQLTLMQANMDQKVK